MFFAAGIAWAAVVEGGPLMPYQTASAILALAVFYCRRRHPGTAFFLLWPFFFVLGVQHAAPTLAPPTDPHHIFNQVRDRQETVVVGILQECPRLEVTRSRLLMAVESIRQADGPELAATGLVLLTVNGSPPSGLLPGDRFMARAVLSPVHRYGILGAFDYQRFLANQSIWLTGWISSPALLMELQQLPPPSLLARLPHVPERLRYRIGQFLDQELPAATAGLYRAILIGDRSGIAPATLEQFKATGTMHLLAISGLHMGLLALMIMGALSWLLRRSTRLILFLPVWKLTALLAMMPLIGYALIAGFQAPVARALLMTLVFLLAILADRQWNVPSNIAIAALLMLIWQPAQLYTVSFQLSFAAVIAIALLLPRLWPLFVGDPAATPGARYTGRVLAALAVSIAATAGTLPLVLYYFNRFSPIGPLATLVVEPFLCLWALTAGLLACMLLPLSSGLAGLLLQAGAFGLTIADRLTATLAGLPFSTLWFSTPTAFEMLGLFILPVALLHWKRNLAARYLTLLALLLLAAPSLFLLAQQRFDQHTRVTILDIGQGSSVLAQLPGGKKVLIDGGGHRSERFDPGEGIIAPYLWRQRITRLDGVVISHPHADHYNGLFYIIERFRPRIVWVNGRSGTEPEYQRLLELIKAADIPLQVPEPGMVLLAGGKAGLVNVADLHLRENSGGPNEESLVIRLDHGQISFLFPGDIGLESERLLLTEFRTVRADVLLAGHHGSPGSNSRDFLHAVAPRYIPVSLGPFGSFHARVEPQLALWRELGLNPLPTAACGSIMFSTDGQQLQAATFRSCPEWIMHR
jgi:competence protein ComEC